MIGASTLALLFVPLFFYLFERLKEKRQRRDEAIAAAAGLAEPRPGVSD